MSEELRLYSVVVGGNETTMQLTETDAKRLDATLIVPTAAPSAHGAGVQHAARGTVPNRARRAD